MTNYFENCKNLEELKATYKQIVKKFHPDVYGEKGNEILKEVHNQLEKALKNVDKKAYIDLYNDSDNNESEEIRAAKEELAKELFKNHKAFAYQYLFAEYILRGWHAANHRNPLTRHNFQGWNVWQLELKMLVGGFKSVKWSTFAQYKNAKNSVKKGAHGAYITLAIIAKPKKDDKEKEDEEKRPTVYYKGYTVFNEEQTQNGAAEKAPAQIAKVIQIATAKKPEQKSLWDSLEVVA